MYQPVVSCTTLHPLQWRHNERDGVSNHQPRDYLLNRLFGRISKKTSKLHVTGLCAGNSPGTGEFPAPRASNAENVSIWWRYHAYLPTPQLVVLRWAGQPGWGTPVLEDSQWVSAASSTRWLKAKIVAKHDWIFTHIQARLNNNWTAKI